MKSSQKRTVMGLVMVLAVIAAIVAGCFVTSGSESSKSEPWTEGGLQRFSSYQELKDFLKTNPIHDSYLYGKDLNSTLSLGSVCWAEAGDIDFSKTNIQVEGVDEADIVKSDGEYIYLATDSRLIIARAYPPEKAGILCEMEMEGKIEGLFVNGDRVVVLEGEGPVYGIRHEGILSGGNGTRASVKIYDVSDKGKPALRRDLAVDGYYVSSRMIGDYVYVVTSGSAWVNEDNIGLPRIYSNNSSVEIQPAEIWHSATPDNGYGFTTIMSVNMANDDEEPVHETLLLGSASNMYVSPGNIYVTFTDWTEGAERTSIHRIHIDEGRIEYRATGEVPGRLLNQFSMDEHEGHFRVATTIGHAWDGDTRSTSNVYVLDQNLDVFGRLENLAPGEQIHSARFMGSRCYLVTFKKIDPFFVIDLANPGEPRVLGELKITGYSDYLHPYDENHVIGIGKEAIAAEKGNFAWYQGVKISLFDVSDVANPKEIGKYEIGDRGTDSPVLYDHKAFLFDKSRSLLVLPVQVAEIDESDYSGVVPPYAHGQPVWQGAYVFNISVESGLQLRGRITHCSGTEFGQGRYYIGSSSCLIERSLYIGDVLYTISGHKIGMNHLETLAEIGEISLN